MGRVLLVEDNQDNSDLVQFLLKRIGYEVVAASNGRECLDIARKGQVDLILMDLSLPEIDGWTAARMLREDPATASIPLIALTAHTLPGDRKLAIDSGFDDFFPKPLDVPAFPEMLSNALKKANKSSPT